MIVKIIIKNTTTIMKKDFKIRKHNMFYEFKCKNGHSREYCISIKYGPPINVKCDCGELMSQEFGGNFILKGDNWPGKDLKRREYESKQSIEQIETMISEEDRAQRIANEVANIRRQGKNAFKQFKKDNPQKYKDYKDGIKRGIKGKQTKFKK